MDNWDKIFKTYDVRGVYPREINEEVAYKIGRAVAKFLKNKEIAIGQDNRLSSEGLFKSLCAGVCDGGADVIDVGLVTTPMLYWVVARYGYKGGIMVTASHNSAEYNGFKIVKEKSIPIDEDSGLKKIKKIVAKGKFKDKKRGKITKKDVFLDYIENIFRFIDINSIKPLKTVVDTGNGAAGLIVPEIFKRVPAKLIHIFAELDGAYPNHNPNPVLPENTAALQKKVVSEKADCGIAFDGDGDRILFVDEKGERINPNFIFTLLIDRFFRNKGKIVYDVSASRIVREEIKKSGNTTLCTRVGYSFLKEKMSKLNVVFGGESSGHYYLGEDYYIESPFFVLFKILEIISKEGKPLSELIKPFDKYYLERINFKIKENPDKILKELEKKYKKDPARLGRPGKVSLFDGLTIEHSDWWFNIRISNTEPVLRLTIEADTKELLEEKKQELLKLIPSSL